MRPLCALVLFAGLVGSVPAADPAPSPFPQPKPAPPPPPVAPPAGAVLNLTPDALYVVSYAGEGVLRVHPAGLVAVTRETGPIRVRAKFADGAGRVETRTFPGPAVWLVEALPGKSGRIELDLVPVGASKDSDILTATVDVGQAPPPAPKPVYPPKPDPAPVAAPGAWVIVVHDETAAAPASLSGPTLARLMKDGRGHVYGTQKDTVKVAAKKYDALLAEAGVAGPGLIVLDRLGAKVLVAPLPATDADLAAKLKGVVPGV